MRNGRLHDALSTATQAFDPLPQNSHDPCLQDQKLQVFLLLVAKLARLLGSLSL